MRNPWDCVKYHNSNRNGFFIPLCNKRAGFVGDSEGKFACRLQEIRRRRRRRKFILPIAIIVTNIHTHTGGNEHSKGGKLWPDMCVIFYYFFCSPRKRLTVRNQNHYLFFRLLILVVFFWGLLPSRSPKMLSHLHATSLPYPWVFIFIVQHFRTAFGLRQRRLGEIIWQSRWNIYLRVLVSCVCAFGVAVQGFRSFPWGKGRERGKNSITWWFSGHFEEGFGAMKYAELIFCLMKLNFKCKI